MATPKYERPREDEVNVTPPPITPSPWPAKLGEAGVRGVRLRVNPIACDAFGYCAELLPELIGADEWGYPIVSDDPVPGRLLHLAERTVRDCPRRALSLEKTPPRGH